jgi:hypothetical protein
MRFLLRLVLWHPRPGKSHVRLVDQLTDAEVENLLKQAVWRGATLCALIVVVIGYRLLLQEFRQDLHPFWSLLDIFAYLLLFLMVVAHGRSSKRSFAAHVDRVRENGRDVRPG